MYSVGSPQLQIKRKYYGLAVRRFQFLFVQLLVHDVQQHLVHVLGQQASAHAPPQAAGHPLSAFVRVQPVVVGDQICVQHRQVVLQIDQLALEEEDLVAALVEPFANLRRVSVAQIREWRITEYPKFGFVGNLFEQSFAGLVWRGKVSVGLRLIGLIKTIALIAVK